MIVIAVIQSGWVFVGEYATTDQQEIKLTRARNIRDWGTTQGLGEIALSGPTRKTILDPAGVVVAPVGSMLFYLECNESAWAGHL